MYPRWESLSVEKTTTSTCNCKMVLLRYYDFITRIRYCDFCVVVDCAYLVIVASLGLFLKGEKQYYSAARFTLCFYSSRVENILIFIYNKQMKGIGIMR